MKRKTYLGRAIFFVLLIVLWELASRLFGTYWFSSPWLTLSRLGRMIWTWEAQFHLRYTLLEAALGFLIGGAAGVLLPFLLRRYPTWTSILDPFLIGGYGMPKLAIAPLFILWFGVGILSKVAIVVSIVFFLVFFNTFAGIRSVHPDLLKVARVMGAKERHLSRDIVWPSAVPYIFTAFKIALPYSVAAAIIGELISSNKGLGYFIEHAANDFDTTGVFVGLIIITAVIMAINDVVNRLQRRALSWRREEFEELRNL